MNSNIQKLEEELDEFKLMSSKIKQGGLYECFNNYSHFNEINDKQFHSLKKDLLEKGKELENYIHSKIIHLEEKINNSI